jgi:hypothetical protein
MKLSQGQLALDPGVAKLHHFSATTVLRLRFNAGHLSSERNDHRTFFHQYEATAMALIFRTALRFTDARLAFADFAS